MTQETVRFSETIVTEVETLVEEGVFDNKSEFYRFAAEFVLDELNPEYTPVMDLYEQTLQDIQEHANYSTETTVDETAGSLYRAAVVIRQYARQGKIEQAEAYIDSHYPPERGEYLLLEALLGFYQEDDS